MTSTQPFDVLAIGRSGVDIYPLQIGVGLEDVETFGKFLGGSAANVAVAAARLGQPAALITGVGDDPFGRFVRAELRDLGVDDRYVVDARRAPDAGHVLRDLPAGRLPAVLLPAPDRAGPADRAPTSSTSTRSAARELFWTTVTGLSEEPSRCAHHAAWEARDRAPLTVLDLDYRPMFWDSPGGGHRAGPARRCRTSPSPSATARSARSRSARPTRTGPPTRCSSPASSSRS